MKNRKLNHWLGFALLLSIICFFFYKSVFSDSSLDTTLSTIEKIQDLQVQLHRDLLRYRSNQIQSYDNLNETLISLNENINSLSTASTKNISVIHEPVTTLKQIIKNESLLVEDFKTHHSILQNSLFYIFNRSTRLYAETPDSVSNDKQRLTAELITLLLEYNESPKNNIANKIYTLIDKLNNDPDTDTNALINHSLMIIERLPEIDNVLNQFNSLRVENKIALLQNIISDLKAEQSADTQTYHLLLFLSTIYLIFYIIYIFINLQRNKEELSSSNNKLSDEVNQRARTEKALYHLVNIDKNSSGHNDEDRVLFLLNALCKALDVEYSYLTKFNSSGSIAEIIGLLDHGIFTSNIAYQIQDTPCEEVIKNGRLVLGDDFSNYFPGCSRTLLENAVSYIGISLLDKKENVIGMIAIGSDSPIPDTNLAENILTIATSRAIIELELQIEINNSKRYQQGLSLIDDWIARLITEGYNKNEFFRNICHAAKEITNSHICAFPVLRKNKEQYSFLSTSGIEIENLKNTHYDIDDNDLFSWPIMNNKNLLINNLDSDPRAQSQLPEEFATTCALLTPVTLKDEPYGAIAVFRSHDDFDNVDEQLMTQFSQSVQMAIINMQLVNDIKSERERAEVTLHSIGDAVITTNSNGKIEYMNHIAESLTAWTLEEAKNKSIQDVFLIEDIDTQEAMHELVMSCLDEGVTINKSILKLVNKNGNKKDIESSISPILNTSGITEGIVIVFHDETQRRQLENKIKHQAAHDPLTDLLNRDAFDAELSNHVYGAIHDNQKHVLCYLDLDRFKLINDTAGHSAGDQCLIQVTSLIQSCIRNDDILGRLGGDEFGLILQNCNDDSALRIATNITKSISDLEFFWEGCNYNLGVSIGISPLNKSTADAADAIKKADLACYTAKDKGRGRVYLYEEQDSELIRRQEENYWATRIKKAIEDNRLRLYAQSIVPLKNNHLHTRHYEILVRLLDEDNNLVQPNAFIPAAERYNLMSSVDRKIIYETFKFIHKHADEDSNNTHYSINLSGNTLCDEKIIDYINGTAEKFRIDTKTICFEITETTAIKNLQQAKSFIKKLKFVGFKFALDDFGSGLSSFQYLKNLPVDYLKIDGSFVADMVNNNIDHAMVSAINEIGHVMGIQTIAEYVENDQIIKKLQDMNVDYGQGYGIEQPKPLEETLLSIDDEDSSTLKIVYNKP
ncbi:MAG: EAL domain-containing protein [Gammaproteobacteria bacterium]|nr:EAL domain-containing protein [Gammaproteobacteria bacterium]